jgi:hypothetical protein
MFCKLGSKTPLDPANDEQLNRIFPAAPPPLSQVKVPKFNGR